VVHALRADRGLGVAELRALRAETAERRGRFEDGVVLERVEE
jgi:hypothetical protein